MKLDLIIPVYRNVDLVRACLESLTAHLDEIRVHSPTIIVINDSPDDEAVGRYLTECQAAGLVDIYIRNPENVGFVKSVNKGLAIAKKHGAGAILVNSDTITYQNTLSEMVAVLQSDPQIGFVCPRSNNASIATFPQSPHNLSGIATTPEICHIAWESVYRHLPRHTLAPTAVGFYMLISPQVIANFGYLDEEFGIGYEEENDLVMRAGKVGYRAALANHAFAYHAGSASFMLHEMDLKGQQQSNLQKMTARHPQFLPLVQEFERSPEYRAMTQIKNLVPTADGKLKIALNLLTMGSHHNGTNEQNVNILHALDELPHGDFEIYVICDRTAAEFHGLSKLKNIKLRTEIAPVYAISILLCQPFDLHEVNVMEHLAPINIYGMLDVIALDCGHLHGNNLDGGKNVYTLWSHIARNANGLFFNSRFSHDIFVSRFSRKYRADDYTRLLPTRLAAYKGRYAGLPTGREHVLVMGNHFAHKAAGITGRIIAEHIPSLSVIVMGAGNGGELRNIRELQAGVVPDSEMNELFATSSVIVLPSYYEGFGLSLLHALTLGKPIVARDIPATREILSSFDSIEGLFLYFDDQDLPGQIRKAVEFGRSTVVERDGIDWHEWSKGLFDFATDLIAKSDLYDRLMDRIEDGDVMRKLASEVVAPPPPVNLTPSATVDVPAILALDDQAFVEAFYKQALGRNPDPAGLSHHVALLSSGVSKSDMLRSILQSPEFAERRASITVIGAELVSKKTKTGGWLRTRH
ncbi:glycosyltransferase [Sphingobium sp. BYY-5]|uniref:glycosyltransferase n=1 Tax=Sphingobium sp. BYY-5 TaxID=2926400 RepID=UPI001FA7DB58|nr:glycosyltransferase [Sphingobium sp. BYY-5]MCI4588528.1 glycosyltransferase [Sphingobium sp. BYY-5]